MKYKSFFDDIFVKFIDSSDILELNLFLYSAFFKNLFLIFFLFM